MGSGWAHRRTHTVRDTACHLRPGELDPMGVEMQGVETGAGSGGAANQSNPVGIVIIELSLCHRIVLVDDDRLQGGAELAWKSW